MNKRTIARLAGALAVVLSPVAAFGQAVVITAPPAQPVPTLSIAMLAMLGIGLAAIAILALRRAPAGAATTMALISAVTLSAIVGQAAPSDVIVENDECLVRFEHEYNANDGPRLLVSLCPNPIEVVALDPNCDENNESVEGEILGSVVEPLCTVGTILSFEDSCRLPDCNS